MAEEFVKIDLHIHTPESSDYSGKKDDEEYFRILKSAKKKKLGVIAITDHNSVDGYEKLMRLQACLAEKKQQLLKDSSSAEIKRELDNTNRKLSLFDNILILPGIEFGVKPGIHLLVIFNNNVTIDKIKVFLIDGGYNSESFGNKQTAILPRWDVLDIYNHAKKYDCIIIDAHTDANKGIWETTSGEYRASCLRAEELVAVAYKNDRQKDNITKVLNTSTLYKRMKPLSFVRFSDSHNYLDIGSLLTWVKLEKLDFISLRDSFANPAERVSVEHPKISNILHKLIQGEKCFGIKDLSEDNMNKSKQLLCGLNNSTGGYILFGLDDNMVKVGLPVEDEKESKRHVNEIFAAIGSIEGDLGKLKITIYPLQGKKEILSLYVPANTNLCNVKGVGSIYSLHNRKLVQLTAKEIEDLVEERSFSKIKPRLQKQITTVEKSCQLIRSLFDSLPIIRKFERKSKLLKKPDLEKSIVLDEAEIEKLKKTFYNGKSRGNLFFFREKQTPRLEDACLRYSLPLFNLRSMPNQTKEIETIYIVPGGGVYYSRRSYPFFAETNNLILKLSPYKEVTYTQKFLACFLKSSFILWYLHRKIEDIDMFVPHTYFTIRIPIIDYGNPDTSKSITEIENNFNKILDLERQFLVESQNMDEEAVVKEAGKHNKKVDVPAYEIDLCIYKLLGLSDDEVAMINRDLNLNGIYVPNVSIE